MKTSGRIFSKIAVVLSVIASFLFAHIIRAGWTGAMNGTGYGWASVNVVSYYGYSNNVQTLNMTGPSAAMAPSDRKSVV